MTLHKSHNLLVIDFAFPICQRAKVEVYEYQGSRTKIQDTTYTVADVKDSILLA